MSAAHSDKSGPEEERAVYWANEAARKGDPMGEILMGLHLFQGSGIQQNKIAGYKLIQKASTVSDEARDLLPKLKAAMSPDEIAAVR